MTTDRPPSPRAAGDVFGRIRASCARVAAAATHVAIVPERLESYADELAPHVRPANTAGARPGDPEAVAAFTITLDAVNFGSGWFPVVRKRPGLSGYRTVAATLADHVSAHGAIRADWLRSVDAGDCARVFGQPIGEPAIDELMALFATALNHLGTFVGEHGDDTFLGLIRRADGSAAALLALLRQMPFYRDVHDHPTGEVWFYKRAQITAHDLAIAFGGRGPGRFHDLDRLTMFADNLVPHVLRLDGMLRFSDPLVARIEAGTDIGVGSVEEVEVRACGLHAVELLVGRLARVGRPVTAGDLDTVLWTRGAEPRYKSRPRHRARCVYY